MARASSRQDMSLKSLELFQICAREGSFQAAAHQSGLAISTISHHMRALEDHLGAELFNHARRPMILTPTGKVFLRNIDVALVALRKAKAEATAGNAQEIRHLRIGAIEDFDSDVTPELAVFLSSNMPSCEFSYHTNTSQLILEMLRNRELDLGITTAPTERMQDLRELALLKDPFVIALPARNEGAPEDILSGVRPFPFLRFSSNLIIARQIEAQLRRIGLSPPFRFESDNSQTLLAMVAAGAGWTITTPLLFARARRFQKDVRLHEFPGRRFARTLSIITTPDCPRSVVKLIHAQMRRAITAHAITPVCTSAPWLAGQFTLVE